jgi:hypothetical protein
VLEALEAFGPERLEAVRDVVLKYRTTVTLWRAGTEVDPAHLGVVDALLDTLWSGKTPHPRWGDGGMTLAAPKAGAAALRGRGRTAHGDALHARRDARR